MISDQGEPPAIQILVKLADFVDERELLTLLVSNFAHLLSRYARQMRLDALIHPVIHVRLQPLPHKLKHRLPTTVADWSQNGPIQAPL